ncbi:MAG: hypothetical protein J0H46_02530 [Bacteroidetes bacterium]|nr:hypothetical protein [Bacteroidota bacterium]
MYIIRKYADCWAIHNDDTGASRPLSETEKGLVLIEFPALAEEKLRSIFTDEVESITP